MTPDTPSTQQDAPTTAMKAMVSRAYARSASEQLEEKRILGHLPLVRHVVGKVVAHFTHHVDVENLISAGTLGLVKAAKAFDPTRDTDFKTYAYIRIRGAVIDELRGESFVPTAAHKQIRLVQHAYRRFFERNGRPPGDDELAAEVGVSPEQLYRTLEEARRQHFLSIHGLGSNGEGGADLMPVDQTTGPEKQAERKEMLERLTAAVMDLPARDRQMLLLYYERDLTMKEIAAVLEITESRVSQMHAAAVFKLSMKMKVDHE